MWPIYRYIVLSCFISIISPTWKRNMHIHNSNPSHSKSVRSEIVLPGQGSARPVQLLRPKQQVAASLCTNTLHSNLRQVPHNMITCCPVLCNPVSPSPSYHYCNPLRSPVLKKEKALASPPSQRQHDAQPAVICNLWLLISNFQSQPLSLSGCLPDSSMCFISLRTRADKSWKLWRKGIIWQHMYPY